MKKIAILFLLLTMSFCVPIVGTQFVCAQIPASVRVVYSKINVYSQTNVNDDATVIIATYGYNQTFTTIGDETILGVDQLQYYKVEVVGVDGYSFGFVLVSQVADASINSPTKKLDTNAVLNKQANVYILSGSNYEMQENLLEKGTKVKILSGYNKANEYTQIQYQSTNGDIVTAYVKTDCLKTSAVSRTLIGAIVIIVTTISLVLIIFGVGGKKKIRKAKSTNK